MRVCVCLVVFCPNAFQVTHAAYTKPCLALGELFAQIGECLLEPFAGSLCFYHPKQSGVVCKPGFLADHLEKKVQLL